MPPPNRVFYSYMEHRRPEEEEYDVGDFARFMQVPVLQNLFFFVADGEARLRQNVCPR
jgi:hypothetical protein